MMRRNNLGLLEKNCATKNVIERIVDSTGACLAVASPHSSNNSVLTTMQSFEEVSPQHSLIAQFSRILRCSHHRLANQSSSSSYHHNGQMCFVLLWNKREHIICPSLNILNSWGFKLKVFYLKFLAWNNCHKISSHDVHPVGVYFISDKKNQGRSLS